MADESTTYPESLLNMQRLREMVREARGAFAPDRVALALHHRTPAVIEDEAAEIADLLRSLAAAARERLAAAGFEPQYDEHAKIRRLPKREREYVTNLGVILTILGEAEIAAAKPHAAREVADEAIAWCRVSGDYRQQAIAWRTLGGAYLDMNELGEEERAVRCGIDAARLSGSAEELALALDFLVSLLVARFRLDEAEAVNAESLEILKESMKEDGERRHYSMLLVNQGRIAMFRGRHADSIRILREALRWSDGDIDPLGRVKILLQLGSVYLRLQHYQQCIECQHEVVRLAGNAGSNLARAWGYFRLAEAHGGLNQVEQVAEMLDRAERYTADHHLVLRLTIAAKRAQLLRFTGALDEGAEICRNIIEQIADQPLHDINMFAHRTLAEIEMRRNRIEEAVHHFRRAIEIIEPVFPVRVTNLKISIGEALLHAGDTARIGALLEEIGRVDGLNTEETARVLRLESAVAEKRGDLREALDLDRQASGMERALLERQAEESLRNARIVAETDLLEREAGLERERRRRVEHELAEAIVQLGDKKKLVDSVEQKLRDALRTTDADANRSVMRAVRETLFELRNQQSATSPLRYLSGVDEDFYRRLRQLCPDLTPKQERLCGLLRAGLASKDISSLLQLGPEGLKAQRKRLRKKLDLKSDERLETALSQI